MVGTVGSGGVAGKPARASRRAVSAKERRQPSWRAAARRTRAAEGWVEGTEAVELDGDGFGAVGGVGAAAAADGFAGEEELREDALELGGPAGFFFAGELGEIGEGLVELGVFFAEEREDAVAEAIAGKGFVGVRGVFAPGLVDLFEVVAEVGAAGLEEGAEDAAGVQGRGDGGEAFEPGAAEELVEDGFGLVVEGVGGEDVGGVSRVQQLAE